MVEVLKKLYGDAVTEESLERFKEELGKKFVPRSEFNQKGEEVKILREKVTSGEEELVLLRQELVAKAGLEEAMKELEKTHASELAALQKEAADKRLEEAVDAALKTVGARNLTAVKALLDRETIHFENDILSGLSEQVEKLKGEQGYLFEAAPDNVQFVRPAGRSLAELTQEDFQNMGYMERLKLKKEQPEIYQTMIQNNRR